jgi:hypothetical protein
LRFKLKASGAKSKKATFIKPYSSLHRFGASGVDGRTMSSSNAAVQQSQQDVNYLALELNLYISMLIGIGTGLDIKNSPPDAKPETLSATLVRFYSCFIIYFGFLAFHIVLFVFFAFHL